MTLENLLQKYKQHLSGIPRPGGNGCHTALLGAANLGIMCGLSPDQVFAGLRQSIPAGTRRVSDREVMDAIKRAVSDHGGSPVALAPGATKKAFAQQKKETLHDGRTALKNIIGQSSIKDEADIFESSPVRIGWPPEEDPVHLLSTLYDPQDLIFIGERDEPGIAGKNIKRAAGWIDAFSAGRAIGPHIIPNPLSGSRAEKKTGDGLTLRGDKNIICFRFCLAEFDNLTHEEQLRFWSAVKLPICALIDTGGKSIHAWIDCRKLGEINTEDHWNTVIRDEIYGQHLVPMGVDKACLNPSRLSRLPGHLRSENKYQRLLWLSPEGRKVIA